MTFVVRMIVQTTAIVIGCVVGLVLAVAAAVLTIAAALMYAGR